MKHALKVLFVFIFVFFCLTMTTYATTKYVVLIDAVNIRKGPSTKYDIIKTGNVGTSYYLKNENKVADTGHNGSCDSGWYAIDYNGDTGYVCSSYVRVETPIINGNPTNACEKSMKDAGFPSSYWKGLCSLKSSHPNWVFKPINTNLDWKTVVDKESACGKNTILTSNKDYIDSTCKYHDGSYKATSQKAVAFYMDPRNFFTEQYIFQFEYLKYDSSLSSSYINASKSIFSNAHFYRYHTSKGNNLPNIVNASGKETNVSPVHLASRIYQELGSKNSLYDLYSGVYTGMQGGYKGYYNFYNIGLSASCINQYGTTYCGLTTAKSRGWNSVTKAITGGASFLSKDYINAGQYTMYLQKFNVVPNNSNYLYTHQYMTNIQAPSSESLISYNSYKKIGLLNSPFVFHIPVYKNIDASISNAPSGGTGGSSSSNSTVSISTMITAAGFKASSGYITGIKPSSTVSSIKNRLETVGGDVEITNANNKTVTSGNIGTGYKITIKNKNDKETYTVVIKGDTSGDGVINAKDLLQIQKNILGTYKLQGAYSKAGDTSNDGNVNAKDLLQVQKSILKTYTINQ